MKVFIYVKESIGQFLTKLQHLLIPTFLIFDHVCRDVSGIKEFSDLVFLRQHQILHSLLLKHKLYQQSKHLETIDSNVTRRPLLRNRSRKSQIDCLGRQLGRRELQLSTYKKATQDQFGLLLIDLDPRLN